MAKFKEAPQPIERLLPAECGRMAHKFISRAISGMQSDRPGTTKERTNVLSPKADNPYAIYSLGYNDGPMHYEATVTVKYPTERRDGRDVVEKNKRQIDLLVTKRDSRQDEESLPSLSKFSVTATYSYGDRFGNGPDYLDAFGPVDGSAKYGWSGPYDIDSNLKMIEGAFSHLFQDEQMSPEATGAVTFGLQAEIDARLRMTPEYVDTVLKKTETGLMKSSSNPNVMENTFVIGDQRISVSRMLQGVGSATERVETERLYIIDVENLDPNDHNLKPISTTRIQISTTYSFVANFETGKLVTSDLEHHDGGVIVLKDGELHMIDDSDPESYKEVRGMIPFLNTDPFEYFHPQPPKKIDR